MKKWLFFFFILAALFIEVAFLGGFRIFNAKPNLLLILVVIASLCFEFKWAFLFAVVIGMLKDVFCADIFCINTLMFALWSLLVARLSREITIDNEIVSIILIFFVVFLNDIALKAAFAYSGRHIPFGIFLRVAIFDSLFTMLVAFPVFRIIKPQFYS